MTITIPGDPQNAPEDWHCPNMGAGLNTTRANCLQRQQMGCKKKPCKHGKRLAQDPETPVGPEHQFSPITKIYREPPINTIRCDVPGCEETRRADVFCENHYRKARRSIGKCLAKGCSEPAEDNHLCAECAEKEKLKNVSK